MRNFLFYSFSIFLFTILGFFILEISLRFISSDLPLNIRWQLEGSYSFSSDGIFKRPTRIRIPQMKPNVTKTVSYFHLSWTHQTDSLGFRNSSHKDSTDILLIGDSMVYGHGVNQDSTLTEFFQTLSGKSTYNAGVSGGSLLVYMETLPLLIQRLNPRIIFHFIHFNDPEDNLFYSDDDSTFLTDFLNRWPHETRQSFALFKTDISYFFNSFYSQRLLTSFKAMSLKGYSDSLPPFVQSQDLFSRYERGIDFEKSGILKLSNYLKEYHILYIPVLNYHGGMVPFESDYFADLENFFLLLQIPFINLKNLFSGMPPNIYLIPNDGHYTIHGHQLIANYLHQFLLDTYP